MCLVIKILLLAAAACGAAIPIIGIREIWLIVVRGEKRGGL